MFGIVLVLLLGGAIVAASVRLQRPQVDQRVTIVLLGCYVPRLAVSSLTRTAYIFTTGPASDSSGYERTGEVIARAWQYTGIHYMTGDDMPGLEHTSLPANIFAAVTYFNSGPSHLGCVATVAAAATFACLNLYLLCLQLGARRDVALGITALIAVLPSFFYYSSDTYKDGFVVLFSVGILGCSVRLAQKFSISQLGLALLWMGGLWLTRYYLVFAMPAPLLLGVLGLRSGSVLRFALAVLVIGTSLTAAYAYSDVPENVTSHAVQTFQGATSTTALNANADTAPGASGVSFEDDSAVGSFLPKLAYTLFAPFPWQSGSIGLQLAKIEAFVWYFFLYRAMRAARMRWRDESSNLLIFFSFIVPMTVAYAFSFANIGLIVRERLGIVLATIAIASLSWPERGYAPLRAHVGDALAPQS